MFISMVVRHDESLLTITSDSKLECGIIFGKLLYERLKINWELSGVFHSPADGLTEYPNTSIEYSL